MKRQFALFLFFTMSIKLLVAQTCGCSMIPLDDELKGYNFIIIGTVIAKQSYFPSDSLKLVFPCRDTTKWEKIKTSLQITKNTVVVKKKFNKVYINPNPEKRDRLPDTLVVYSGGDCENTFEISQKYIIYGYLTNISKYSCDDIRWPVNETIPITNRCTRTKEYSKKEMRFLKKKKMYLGINRTLKYFK